MSSPPTKYIRSYDYAIFNPALNVDFDRVKDTTDQTIDRLALIQYDDGTLRDVIGTAQITDKAVTEPKLADLSVSTRTLQALAVTTAKIALLAVGAAQLSDAAVTQAKLGLLSVGTPQLIDGAVTAAKLAPGAVTGASLGPGSVGTAALADLSVTQAKLALLSVGTPQLIDGAVTTPKLGASLGLTGIPTAPTALTGTNTTQLATTAFVAASMSAAGLITEAPNDGKLYGRFALGWQRGVAVAGDTMTGLLLLSADPAAALGAATKQYADTKVSKAGDTMTGNLAIKAVLPAWGASWPALSIGLGGAIGGYDAQGLIVLYNNLFFDGATYKYIAAGAGGIMQINGGVHSWWAAPGGAAGANAVIAEKMHLDAAGRLGLGRPAEVWNAALLPLAIGKDGALVGALGASQIGLYSNVYHDGANYKYISADAGAMMLMASGGINWYTAPVGVAGAVAVPTVKMSLDNVGQLHAHASFGGVSFNVMGNRPVNVPQDMFYIPAQLNNLANGIIAYIVIVNDDSNTGYAMYFGQVMLAGACFSGSLNPPGGITVTGLQNSINSGVLAVACSTQLISGGNLWALRITPTTTGATGASTCRVYVRIEVIGNDYGATIQRL